MTKNSNSIYLPFSSEVLISVKMSVICPKYIKKKGKVMPAKMEVTVPIAI